MRQLVLASVLGLMVGATDLAEAGQILTYTYAGQGSSDFFQWTISGSFQVDSDHIGTSGDTDISSFITNLSFTISALGPIPSFTFDPASGFMPMHVKVTPSGELTGPESLFAGPSAPTEGDGGDLIVFALEMRAQDFTLYDGNLAGEVAVGSFDWTHTPLLGATVAEPASLALVVVGALTVVVCSWCRRADRTGPLTFRSDVQCPDGDQMSRPCP
jgi:hypothetical protein